MSQIIIADKFSGEIESHSVPASTTPDNLARRVLEPWREGSDRIVRATVPGPPCGPPTFPAWFIRTDNGDLDVFAYQIG